LEKKGHYEHGYFWYRAKFIIEGNPSGVELALKMNDMDRYIVFINGDLRWREPRRALLT